MFSITVGVDKRFWQMRPLAEAMYRGALPNTSQAVAESTRLVQEKWIQLAMQSFKRATGSYVHGIEEGTEYPVGENPFWGRVINRSRQAAFIEYGTPPHDLKKALNTSHQIRIVKSGKRKGMRYLIIPFEHGTPGAVTKQAMPEEIYSIAKKLTPSERTGTYFEASRQLVKAKTRADVEILSRYSGRARKVIGGEAKAQRYRYRWGEHLTREDVGDRGRRSQLTSGYTWKHSPYEGMYRFKRKGGGSLYLTFRMMGDWQSGAWIHPGTVALHLAERAREQSKAVVIQKVREGITRDLQGFKSMLGG